MILESNTLERASSNSNHTYKIQDDNPECLVVNSIIEDHSNIPERKESIEIKHAVKKSATRSFFDSSKTGPINLNNNETSMSESKMNLDEIKHAVKKSATKVLFEDNDIERIRRRANKIEFDSQSIGTSQETDCSNSDNYLSGAKTHTLKSKSRKVGQKINSFEKRDSAISPPNKKLKLLGENNLVQKPINSSSDNSIHKDQGTKKRSTIIKENSELENLSGQNLQQENQSNEDNGEEILTESTRNEVIAKIFPDRSGRDRSSGVHKKPLKSKSKFSKYPTRPHKIEPPKPPQEIPIGDRISAWNQLKSGYLNRRKIAIAKSENSKSGDQIKSESTQEPQLRIFNEDIQIKMQNNEPGTLNDLFGRLKAFLRDKAQTSLNSYILDGNEDLLILFGRREIPYDDLSNLVLNSSSVYVEENDWRKRASLDKDGKEKEEADN
ncbi:unnamed protein product [Blepharisma stoltei]|uniref:Uncharacterized protein n=1 Tax=Blepharisma stoltei TaxID=1481888 RepID=A0AAU9J835_9CILI|nr:unnamed protein product [Blepharisma stoltei]